MIITYVLLGNNFIVKQFLTGLCFYNTPSEAADTHLPLGDIAL